MGFKTKKLSLFLLGLFILLFGLSIFVSLKNKFYTGSHLVLGLGENSEVVQKEEKINKVLELREKYQNDDIVGNVMVDGTSIDEAVLKYKDNNYYLHHDNYGNYEINGSIFLDHRVNLNDRKVLIFGHSSIYEDIPFNELEKYYSYDFYKEHKYITLTTENDEYKYEIFSVYVETSDFTYMNLKIDDDTYNRYLKDYKRKSLYDTGVGVADLDEVIILQTCSNDNKYHGKKKYLLVIGKKIFKEGY